MNFRVRVAPVGKTTAHDNKKKEKMVETVKALIPNKKVEEMLKGFSFLNNVCFFLTGMDEMIYMNTPRSLFLIFYYFLA